jgi:S1-C subfamily serine protease
MRRARRRAAAWALVAALALAAAGLGRGPEEPPPPPPIVSVLVAGAAADSATGFVAGRRRVVTVAHVLDSGGRVVVRGAGRERLGARVVRVDHGNDLALLAVDDDVTGLRAPRAAHTRVLSAEGGRLRALETDVRRRIRARVGDLAGSLYTRDALELAADVAGGDSGSPVIGVDGRLLGVVFARSERRPHVAYATDAAAVARLLSGVQG